eukprot:GHVS01056023.1.p3 GENE.GHVS01056023.1~~GHVS01056023.1.p3  ORF type:complete len:169 (+),score=9.64 GHVS01056023.1:11-517(+)
MISLCLCFGGVASLCAVATASIAPIMATAVAPCLLAIRAVATAIMARGADDTFQLCSATVSRVIVYILKLFRLRLSFVLVRLTVSFVSRSTSLCAVATASIAPIMATAVAPSLLPTRDVPTAIMARGSDETFRVSFLFRLRFILRSQINGLKQIISIRFFVQCFISLA